MASQPFTHMAPRGHELDLTGCLVYSGQGTEKCETAYDYHSFSGSGDLYTQPMYVGTMSERPFRIASDVEYTGAVSTRSNDIVG